MKNILVTLEIEEQSQVLVEKAKTLAEKFDSKIWLLHVAAPDPDFVGFDVGPQYIRDSRAEELKEEHRFVQKFADELRNANIEAQGVLLLGATIDMIIYEANKLEVDLIILGHHQQSLLEKIFVGSTASEVIKKADVPILIVPLEK